MKYPSRDVVKICSVTETFIKCGNLQCFTPQFISKIGVRVFREVHNSVFCGVPFEEHLSDQDLFNNHKKVIIHEIVHIFLTTRLRHETKKFSTDQKYIRHKVMKLILFKNQ